MQRSSSMARSVPRSWPSVVVLVAVSASSCGGGASVVDGGGADAANADGLLLGRDGPIADAAIADAESADGGDGALPDDALATDGGAPDADPYADGRWPAPALTFTIPSSAISSSGELYLPDVQAKFPSVDWAHLDRLYIPAGHYALINLGNLPVRDAARPLVITNLGGQVLVGGLPSGYLFTLAGGAHWVLTGRYDAVAKTGDAAFPGHRGGDYPHARGRYGFLVDDQLSDFPTQGRTGITVNGRATAFELEFLEVARVSFAGVQAKTHDDPTATMDDVRFHDLYIHDVGSEGFYIGDTGDATMQHQVTHLALYNNRVLRTGSEAVQTGQLGDGASIHHNVFAFSGRMFRDAFECSVQDGNGQYQQRAGTGDVHHNVFISGEATLLQVYPLEVASDVHPQNGLVSFHDNYFSSSAWMMVYVSVYTPAPPNFRLDFTHNWFRDLAFTYGANYPNLAARPDVFVFSDVENSPMTITGTSWEGSYALHPLGSATDGTFGMVTVSGSMHGALPPIEFRDDGLPAGTDLRKVEFWVPSAGCYDQWASGRPVAGAPPPAYSQGTIAMWMGTLYRLDASSSTGERPDQHPEHWTSLGAPVDDVRLTPTSPYQGVGLAY